ncbi:hypothetical protein NFI96_019377, partial [Prochilodus magdalenae]
HHLSVNQTLQVLVRRPDSPSTTVTEETVFIPRVVHSVDACTNTDPPHKCCGWLRRRCPCPPRGLLASLITKVSMAAVLFGVVWSITEKECLPGGNLFGIVTVFLCALTGGKLVGLIRIPKLPPVPPLLAEFRDYSAGSGSGCFVFSTQNPPGFRPLWHAAGRGSSSRNIPVVTEGGSTLTSDGQASLRKHCTGCYSGQSWLADGWIGIATHYVTSPVKSLGAQPHSQHVMYEFVFLAACCRFVLGSCVSCSGGSLHAAAPEGWLWIRAGGSHSINGQLAALMTILAITRRHHLSGHRLSPQYLLSSSVGSTWFNILRGLLEVLGGMAAGLAFGFFLHYFPSKDQKDVAVKRSFLLLGLSVFAVFGSNVAGFPGSGGLCTLVLSFFAGLGWRKSKAPVEEVVDKAWDVFQPLLFGLIGAEITISALDPRTVGLGLAALSIALTVRIFFTYLMVLCAGFNLKEKLFIALAWMPKATVQAAIGSTALDMARSKQEEQMQQYGMDVLTVAVLSILITAPIGALLIGLCGPRLLQRPKNPEWGKTCHLTHIDNRASSQRLHRALNRVRGAGFDPNHPQLHTGPHHDLAISFGSSLITLPEDTRSLGVILDGQLSFSAHIGNLTRSCRFLLYSIRRIRPFPSQEATQLLVQSLVISRLDYCNSLLASLALRTLELVQNAAARLIFNLPKFTHLTPLLRSLHWLPVAALIRFKTLMLAYKARNGPAPPFLQVFLLPEWTVVVSDMGVLKVEGVPAAGMDCGGLRYGGAEGGRASSQRLHRALNRVRGAGFDPNHPQLVGSFRVWGALWLNRSYCQTFYQELCLVGHFDVPVVPGESNRWMRLPQACLLTTHFSPDIWEHIFLSRTFHCPVSIVGDAVHPQWLWIHWFWDPGPDSCVDLWSLPSRASSEMLHRALNRVRGAGFDPTGPSWLCGDPGTFAYAWEMDCGGSYDMGSAVKALISRASSQRLHRALNRVRGAGFDPNRPQLVGSFSFHKRYCPLAAGYILLLATAVEMVSATAFQYLIVTPAVARLLPGLLGSCLGMCSSVPPFFLDREDILEDASGGCIQWMERTNTDPPHICCGRLAQGSATAHLAGTCSQSTSPKVSMAAVLFGVVWSITEKECLPGGNLFGIITVLLCALTGGKLVRLVCAPKLPAFPPLLGMLLAGVLLRNIPVVTEAVYIDFRWSASLRNIALAVILSHAGLGLDGSALRKLKAVCVRVAVGPCLTEAFTVALVSHFLLGLPWIWGFILGFVLGAVSPAVVVPAMLQLQKDGYGSEQGVPTLLMAAGSFDDILCITGFSTCLSIAFNTDSIWFNILRGLLEIVGAMAAGLVFGLFLRCFPSSDHKDVSVKRSYLLLGLSVFAVCGSHVAGFPGSGGLCTLVLSFCAGLGWRESKVSPLFIMLRLGLVTLAIALTVRISFTFLMVHCAGFNRKEKLFIALAWMPKATVQATIGSMALDMARSKQEEQMQHHGMEVLTLAFLSILITAPVGALLIGLCAPRLLQRPKDPESGERRHLTYTYIFCQLWHSHAFLFTKNTCGVQNTEKYSQALVLNCES